MFTKHCPLRGFQLSFGLLLLLRISFVFTLKPTYLTPLLMAFQAHFNQFAAATYITAAPVMACDIHAITAT